MKRVLSSIFLFTTAVFILSASSNNTNSQLTTKSYKFDSFSKIEIYHIANVHIKKSEKFSVTVTTNTDFIDKYEVTTTGLTEKTLLCKFKNKAQISNQNLYLDIEISLPKLTSINISGLVSLKLDDIFSGSSLTLIIAGTSNLEGNFLYKNINANVSGLSKLSINIEAETFNLEAEGQVVSIIKGKVPHVTMNIAGSCNINAFDLFTHDITLESTGLGGINLNAEKIICGSISGLSTVKYKGNAQQKIITSGLSTVNKF